MLLQCCRAYSTPQSFRENRNPSQARPHDASDWLGLFPLGVVWMGFVRAQRQLDRGVESNGDVVCRIIPACVDADGLHTKRMHQVPLAASPATGASSIKPNKTDNKLVREERIELST